MPHVTAKLLPALLFCAVLFNGVVVLGQDSNPPDRTKPCFPATATEEAGSREGKTFGYMTATNKCPNDEFSVALVNMGVEGSASVYAMGADAVPVAKGGKHQWLGPYMPISTSTLVPDRKLHVAVRRVADGKFVVPKGVNADGSLVDVSSSRKRVCQLFNKDGSGFAVFRAHLSTDGTRVLRNDFADRDHSPPNTPCEQYVEGGARPVVGGFVDVYAPGSCQFVIDDCRQ